MTMTKWVMSSVEQWSYRQSDKGGQTGSMAKRGCYRGHLEPECKGPVEHLLIYESGLELDSNVDLLKILGEMKEHLSVLWVTDGKRVEIGKGDCLGGCFSYQHTRLLASRGNHCLLPKPTFAFSPRRIGIHRWNTDLGVRTLILPWQLVVLHFYFINGIILWFPVVPICECTL